MTREGEATPEPTVFSDRRRIDPETFELRGDAARSDGSGTAGVADDEAQPQTAGGDEHTVTDNELAQAKAEVADLTDQLARRNADLYNVQQQYNAYVRRAKASAAEGRDAGVADVVESLLGVLDEIELARQHGDLTGPFAAIAEKLEQSLAGRFGLERFGQAGEEFDPQLHEALMHQPDESAETATLSQVMQPGYRIGERVVRAARVAVRGPQ